MGSDLAKSRAVTPPMKIICKNKNTIATGWVIANFPADQTGLAGDRWSASGGHDSLQRLPGGVCGIWPKTIFAGIAPLGSLVLLAG